MADEEREDDSTGGSLDAGVTGGGDNLADGSDPAKPIPYKRFSEVNSKYKAASDELAQTKQKLSQYESYLTSPSVQAAIQAAAKPAAKPEPVAAEEEFDPYDKDSLNRIIQANLTKVFDEQVRPIRELVQRQAWDGQLNDAKRVFGDRFDWNKDQQLVLNKLREVPALTITEAFTLVQAGRNGLDLGGSFGGSAGIETGTGNTASRASANASETLTSDEKVMAKRFQMSEGEYRKFKKEAEAVKEGRVPAEAAAV